MMARMYDPKTGGHPSKGMAPKYKNGGQKNRAVAAPKKAEKPSLRDIAFDAFSGKAMAKSAVGAAKTAAKGAKKVADVYVDVATAPLKLLGMDKKPSKLQRQARMTAVRKQAEARQKAAKSGRK